MFLLWRADLSLLKSYIWGSGSCFGAKGNFLKMGLSGKHRWASRRLVHGGASVSSGGQLANRLRRLSTPLGCGQASCPRRGSATVLASLCLHRCKSFLALKKSGVPPASCWTLLSVGLRPPTPVEGKPSPAAVAAAPPPALSLRKRWAAVASVRPAWPLRHGRRLRLFWRGWDCLEFLLVPLGQLANELVKGR